MVGIEAELKGGFGLSAGVHGTLAKRKEEDKDGTQWLNASLNMQGKAEAGLSLGLGAFVGMPLLMSVSGKLEAGISGSLHGSTKLDFDLLQKRGADKDTSTIRGVNGRYDFGGELKATAVGAVDARVLVFKKRLANVP